MKDLRQSEYITDIAKEAMIENAKIKKSNKDRIHSILQSLNYDPTIPRYTRKEKKAFTRKIKAIEFPEKKPVVLTKEEYKELNPGAVTYYDGCVRVNLSEIKPMIAMPFHPSNVYTIDELNANLSDILHDVEQKALVSLDGAVEYSLQDKIRDGKLYVDQGIIAGCAGGGFENICAAADIIKGHNIGSDAFTFSVYPASTPIYMELVKNGAIADLMEAGTVVRWAQRRISYRLSEMSPTTSTAG